MADKKLDKPENIADEKTYRVTGIIEPPFMADAVGDMYLDGVLITKETLEALSDISDINENISVHVADYSLNIYNSEYREYGVNVNFDELVEIRDALTKIIEQRQSQ